MYVILESHSFQPVAAFFKVGQAFRFTEDYQKSLDPMMPCGVWDANRLRFITMNNPLRASYVGQGF